jgi:hypothetical protein
MLVHTASTRNSRCCVASVGLLDLTLSVNQKVLSDTIRIVVQHMALPPCFHTSFCSKCFQTDATSHPTVLPVVMTLALFTYLSHISHISSIAQLTPIPQHHSYITSTINTEVRGMSVHCRFGALTYEVSGNTRLSETVVSPLYYSSCFVIIHKVINYMLFFVIICCFCYSIIIYFCSLVHVCEEGALWRGGGEAQFHIIN